MGEKRVCRVSSDNEPSIRRCTEYASKKKRHDNGVILSGPVFSWWVGVLHSPTLDFWLNPDFCSFFFFLSPPRTHGNATVVRMNDAQESCIRSTTKPRVCYDSLTYLEVHRHNRVTAILSGGTNSADGASAQSCVGPFPPLYLARDP